MMNKTLRFFLLSGTSAVLGFGAMAQDRAPAPAPDDADAVMSTVVVTGQAQTYSSAETTESMALQQSPVTSVLAQIDNLPGVQVQEGDAFGFDDWSTGVAIRGFQTNLGEQQVGITIDGLPNGGSNYGGGAKANRYIDTQNAGAIEVSQGTADIASRSNEALGGTINFTTQDPLDERRVRVSGSLGDFDAQRFYGRYDTGLVLDGTTSAWISASTQSATDFMEGSAQNRRDHYAAKVTSGILGIEWTAYASYDQIQEDNYQRLFSEAEYDENPNWDRLIGEWGPVPYINQLYRRGWSTNRENLFFYLTAEKEVIDGLTLEGGIYRHDNDGRGDWVPPYLVNVGLDDTTGGLPETEYLGGERVFGGPFLGQIFFVDPTGVALSPEAGCVSSITFPYGGAGAQYDPACYPRNSIPVQSYRHTHYQKERTGLYGDFEFDSDLGPIENTLRGGFWYEDATRYEYRDWHKITDARVGFNYDQLAYWVQYNREFPQTTFKWYVEDAVNFGDVSVRFGAKQFTNEIERTDLFNPTDTAANFTLDSESDVLLSGGLAYQPAQIEGLELFAGYAENYKAIPDSVLEVINVDGGIPDPETSENIEVGARYVGNRLRGSVVYFDSTFENRLFPAPTESVSGIDYLEASNGGFINGGGIESSGFELSGEVLLSENFNLYVSYTDIDATILGTGDSNLDTDAGIAVGNTVPGIAEQMYVVSLDYVEGNFGAGVSTKYVGDRFVDLGNSWVADGYYDSDLYASVSGAAISDQLDNLEFRLTVNNLFDRDWISGISGGGAWISAPRTTVLTVIADF